MCASSSGSTSRPKPFWLISRFWQKIQRRVHQLKKRVPETRSGSFLLAVVRAEAVHYRPLPSTAGRALNALEPVYPAIAGAQVAGFQVGIGAFHPFSNSPLSSRAR